MIGDRVEGGGLAAGADNNIGRRLWIRAGALEAGALEAVAAFFFLWLDLWTTGAPSESVVCCIFDGALVDVEMIVTSSAA